MEDRVKGQDDLNQAFETHVVNSDGKVKGIWPWEWKAEDQILGSGRPDEME